MNAPLTQGAASEPALPTQMCVNTSRAGDVLTLMTVQLLSQPLRSPRDEGPPLEPRMMSLRGRRTEMAARSGRWHRGSDASLS
jgi:hypothetical protein